MVWPSCAAAPSLDRDVHHPIRKAVEDLSSAMVRPYFGYLSTKSVFEPTDHGCVDSVVYVQVDGNGSEGEVEVPRLGAVEGAPEAC